ncbi:MAG: glycosyltransferase family 39 protein [Chitinophagales bacterium]
MKRNYFTQKRIVSIAILFWFVLNLLQAIFTNLHSDEVYYWTYSWKLQWAYWDNAPLIGLYIFIGDYLFPYSEIGVRLITVFSGTLAIYIVWLCTDRKDALLFFALIFGMALMHAGGFMAAPDAPLALANALLLLSYKKYAESSSVLYAVFLGLAMAMVMYSKYQGAMLIGMLLIANPKIVFKRQSIIAVLVFIVAFLPGFLALYNLNFSTFQYHLSGKNPESWKWNWTTDFIAGQFLAAGPFVGLIIIPLLFIHKPAIVFLRSMRLSAIGIYLFLILLSFKVYVLGNWSASVLFPLILIGHDALKSKLQFRKWAIRGGIAGLVLILLFRIYIATTLPLPKTLNFHFRDWDNWAKETYAIAGEKPVVFFNSFQLPARYAFLNKTHQVFSLSNLYYHPTQFDYSKIEQELQGKSVVFICKTDYHSGDSVIDPIHGNYYLYQIHSFCSGQKIIIETTTKTYTVKAGEKFIVPITILPNPLSIDESIICDDYNFYPACHIRLGNKYVTEQIIKSDSLDIHNPEIQNLQVEITAPYEPGSYDMLFSIATDWYIPYFGTNGKWLELIVTP